MSGYSLTFDASHKMKKTGSAIKGYFRHIARDADERANIYYPHRNKNLDSDRTQMNATFVNDGNGGFRVAKSSEDLQDYLDERLSTLKKKPRSNSVMLRGFILQMDPDYFNKECPDWREEGLENESLSSVHEAMLEWVSNYFPHENIVGASLHLDEYSPQLHIAFTPVTEDGRLAQKDFIKGPGHLGQIHTSFRKHMRDAGYEISDKRKTADRTVKRMSDDEYKKYADVLREEASLKIAALNLRESAVKGKEDILRKKENSLKELESEIEIDRDFIVSKKTELAQESRAIKAEKSRLDSQSEDVNRLSEDLNRRLVSFRIKQEEQEAKEARLKKKDSDLREKQIRLKQKEDQLKKSEVTLSKYNQAIDETYKNLRETFMKVNEVYKALPAHAKLKTTRQMNTTLGETPQSAFDRANKSYSSHRQSSSYFVEPGSIDYFADLRDDPEPSYDDDQMEF